MGRVKTDFFNGDQEPVEMIFVIGVRWPLPSCVYNIPETSLKMVHFIKS